MTSKSPAPPVDNERRNYFRIIDKVQLRYTSVDQNSALSQTVPAAFREDIGYSLIRELQLIDREHSSQLRAIADQSRELESYLKAINRKIELLASTFATEHGDDEKELKVVSMSEGGMAFKTDKAIACDSHLALQLTLLPSQITLVLFGQVINCSPLDEAVSQGFSVAVSFLQLTEDDRQTLAKHIMQLQLAQRRQQNDD